MSAGVVKSYLAALDSQYLAATASEDSVPTGVSADAGRDVKPTVRDTATVTVGSAVDGRKRRRHGTEKRPRSSAVSTLVVDPRVMERAHEVCRPGEHLVIDDAEHVHTEYDAPPSSPFA